MNTMIARAKRGLALLVFDFIVLLLASVINYRSQPAGS
jgi:hypothetical protein